MTEIGIISVVMYGSDQFVYGKLQLTDYRDLSSKVGVLGGEMEKVKRQDKKPELMLTRRVTASV